MQWPHDIELELESIAQGGAAVGRYENRAVFAEGGLPGETVQVHLHDRQANFARGRVTDVIRAAPERVSSFCPLEKTCSAADWRWIDYAAQRQFKAHILRDQLRHIGGIDVEVALPPAAPTPAAYRTTADLHVSGHTIGYYRPGTRRVAPVPACCLHHPLINDALAALQPLLGGVALHELTVRCSPETGTVLAMIAGRGPLQLTAQRWRAAFPALAGVVNERGRVLDGATMIERRVGDLTFKLHASSFFQINWAQVEPLVARVEALLDGQRHHRLLDLYCGAGLFALSLAPSVRAVLGVEEWAQAVDDARHNAHINAITNVEFRAGKAEQVLARLEQRCERVVLDPPRRGCAPAVLDALARLHAERIVYVSCHPGTLARDCKQLVTAGYAVTSAEVIDMFPHTSHVESIVRLDRT